MGGTVGAARGNEEARLVKLLVSATQVTLHPPKNWSDKMHQGDTEMARALLAIAVGGGLRGGGTVLALVGEAADFEGDEREEEAGGDEGDDEP